MNPAMSIQQIATSPYRLLFLAVFLVSATLLTLRFGQTALATIEQPIGEQLTVHLVVSDARAKLILAVLKRDRSSEQVLGLLVQSNLLDLDARQFARRGLPKPDSGQSFEPAWRFTKFDPHQVFWIPPPLNVLLIQGTAFGAYNGKNEHQAGHLLVFLNQAIVDAGKVQPVYPSVDTFPLDASDDLRYSSGNVQWDHNPFLRLLNSR
jgi:hypothetical protein